MNGFLLACVLGAGLVGLWLILYLSRSQGARFGEMSDFEFAEFFRKANPSLETADVLRVRRHIAGALGVPRKNVVPRLSLDQVGEVSMGGLLFTPDNLVEDIVRAKRELDMPLGFDPIVVEDIVPLLVAWRAQGTRQRNPGPG